MSTPPSANIPVIDISPTNSRAPQQLLEAASTHGFVYIENNEFGVAQALIDEMFATSHAFFALPSSVKEQAAIKSNAAGSNVGWLKQGVEKLDPATQKNPDVKEALNVSVPLPENGILPALLEPYRRLLSDFERACQDLCLSILHHFAEALSIQPDWFTSRHDRHLEHRKSGSILRILYYPARISDSDAPVEDIRAGAHSDYGSVTLLFQLPGQPGLEIKTADGSWSSVPVDPTHNLDNGKPLPILVNIGDLLEDWTAGLLRSTVHRVVFPAAGTGPSADRYSVAYFCHPLDEVLLEPVPSQLVQQRVGKTAVNNNAIITAREHLTNRLAETYSIT